MKRRRLQVVTVCLVATICTAWAQTTQFGNPFGMQLRPVPMEPQAVWAPAIVRDAPTNECSTITRRDGTLELYAITKPQSNSVSVIRSRAGGLTWSNPEIAFLLPGLSYHAVTVLEAAAGARHAVYHILGNGPCGYRGRLCEVDHTRRLSHATGWSDRRQRPARFASH